MALDNEFILTELMNSGSAALNQTFDGGGNLVVNTTLNTDGETFGYVERPIYNEQQLVKAVDTIVDELIGNQKPEGPSTVLKSVFDDLFLKYTTFCKFFNVKDLWDKYNQQKPNYDYEKNINCYWNYCYNKCNENDSYCNIFLHDEFSNLLLYINRYDGYSPN